MTTESQPKPFERRTLEEVVPHERLALLSQKLATLEATTVCEHPAVHEALAVGQRIIAAYDRLQQRRSMRTPTPASGTARDHIRTRLSANEAGLNFNYAFAWCMETAARVSQTVGESATEEGEDELYVAARSLRTYAKERFITSNLPLVNFYAQAHARALGEEHVDDLLSVGTRGLDRAVELYDYRRGFTFATFAKWHIREQMQKYRRRIEQKSQRESTFTAMTRIDDDARPFEETLSSAVTYEPEDVVIDRTERSWLQHQFDQLDPQARTLLAGRFGIGTDTQGMSIRALSIRCRIPEKQVESELGSIIQHMRRGEGEYHSAPHPLRTEAVLAQLAEASYEEIGVFWFHQYLGFHISTTRSLIGQEDGKTGILHVSENPSGSQAVSQDVFEERLLSLMAAAKEPRRDYDEQPRLVRATTASRMDLTDEAIVASLALTDTRILLTADYAKSLINNDHFVSAGVLAQELGVHRNTMYSWRGATQFSAHLRAGRLSLIPQKTANTIREQYREATGGMTPTQLMQELGISLTTLLRWTDKHQIQTIVPEYGARSVIYPPEAVEQLRQLVPADPLDDELSLSELRDRIGYPVKRLAALKKQVETMVKLHNVATPVRRGRTSRIGSPHYPGWFVDALNARYGGR